MSDLISRNELTEAIKRQYCTGCDNYNGSRCRACHADDMLSLVDDAADAGPRWICVEDEPPKNVYLQVYVAKFGYVEKAKYEGLLWRTSGGESLNLDWVTHWMPLPEPPKEATS